jgi:outer membrane receptor protein involved in Fe transport
MQQDSSDARIVIVVDSLDRAAFANVAELLQARVPGLHISRTGEGGMRWFMRGPASLWGSVPLVLVDDIRFTMVGSSMREFGTRPPPLDELDVENVERIEVWNGPATAAQYGMGAGHGVIRIVSFTPRAQAPSFKLTAAAGMANEAVSYPANFARRGVDTAGNRVRYCTLAAEAQGTCTPIEPPISINPLESDSPFETALGARLAAAVASGSARLAWRAGGSFERQGTTTGTLANQRLHFRGAAALRGGERADVTLRAHWMRGEADLPSLYEPSLLSQGFLAFADTVWPGFARPHPPRYVSMRYGTTIIGRWRPLDWFSARLTSGFERRHDEDTLDYTRPLGDGFGDLRVEADGKRRQRDLTVRLETEARYGPRSRPHVTALTVEYARAREEYEFHEFAGTEGGAYSERRFWIHRPTEITAIGLRQRLHFGQRVALAGGLRVDRVELRDVRWDVPLFPHVSLRWDVRRFTPTPVGGVRLRAALGEVANLPQATSMLHPIASPPAKPKAERTREYEVGFDLRGARDRVSLAVNWYDKRTRDITFLAGAPPFVALSRIEALNRGIEGVLHGQILNTPRLSWSAGVSYTYNHNEVTESEVQQLMDLEESGVLNRQFIREGSALGAYLTFPLVSIRDLDDDGIVDGLCFSDLGSCEVSLGRTPEYHPAFPPRSASLETSLRVGPVTLSALLDHRDGHFVLNIPLHQRCLFLRCQALYDPQSSFQDQAEVELTQEAVWPALQDASYTKLREVSIRVAAPAAWARALGASRFAIVLGGRNLVTWTDYRGLDPEPTSLTWAPVANVDNAAAPLPRRFILRIDVQR